MFLPGDCWEDWRTDQWTLRWLSETFWNPQWIKKRFINKVSLRWSLPVLKLILLLIPSNCDANLVVVHNAHEFKKKTGYWFVPLAVCIRVQSPARWSGRPLFCHTENLEAFPLWTTAAVTCQHGGVYTFPRWVFEDQKNHKKSILSYTFIIFSWRGYYCINLKYYVWRNKCFHLCHF